MPISLRWSEHDSESQNTADAGLQKTFGLPCLEAEILQATVDRNVLPTHVIAAAKELNRRAERAWHSHENY